LKKKYFIKLLIYLITTLVFIKIGYANETINGIGHSSFQRKHSHPKLEEKEPLKQDNNKEIDSYYSLPPLEDEEDSLSSSEKVFIKKFKLKGNTVFSDKELGKLTEPYENRTITSEELQEVKQKITKFYILNGYINSGAIIPDQKLIDDTVLIKIIEGKLVKTEVTGNKWLIDNYILNRLAIATNDGKDPLNINTLQERLKIIKQDPLVDNINANLGPGLELGEAELKVRIDEARPYNLNFEFSNHNSPSIGSYRGNAEIEHLNISGWGDSFNFQYGLSEGLDDFSAEYKLPVNRCGSTIGFEIDRADSVVVAETFEDIGIEGNTVSLACNFHHFFYKTVSQEFAMGVKLEKRKSETQIFNVVGIPFTSGVNDEGKSRVTALRFTQEWLDRSLNQVIAFRSMLSIGIDAFDSSTKEEVFPITNDSEINNRYPVQPDSNFSTLLLQLQWIRRIEQINSQFVFKLDMRLSDSPLLSMEKFAIGGASTVRGYRENQLTTDNGIISTLELRIPVFQLNIPGISNNPNDGILYIAPFIDFGKGGNTSSEDPDISEIYSIGLGARWSMSNKIYAEIYYGFGLRDVDDPTDWDLQDDGLHFLIRSELF